MAERPGLLPQVPSRRPQQFLPLPLASGERARLCRAHALSLQLLTPWVGPVSPERRPRPKAPSLPAPPPEYLLLPRILLPPPPSAPLPPRRPPFRPCPHPRLAFQSPRPPGPPLPAPPCPPPPFPPLTPPPGPSHPPDSPFRLGPPPTPAVAYRAAFAAPVRLRPGRGAAPGATARRAHSASGWPAQKRSTSTHRAAAGLRLARRSLRLGEGRSSVSWTPARRTAF